MFVTNAFKTLILVSLPALIQGQADTKGVVLSPIFAADAVTRLSQEETRTLLAGEAFTPGKAYASTVDVARLAQGGPFPTTQSELSDFLEAVRNEIGSRRRSLVKQPRGLRNCNSNNDRQTVYLEFPTEETFDLLAEDRRSSPTFSFILTFNSYTFSDEDKQFILERLQADYDGFKLDFVLDKPSGCDYSTLSFSTPSSVNFFGVPGISILFFIIPGDIVFLEVFFGQADQIDFRNKDQTDSAFIQANVWTAITQFFLGNPAGAFSFFSGIAVDQDTSLEEAVKIATLNQAANTAGHELGHILGFRHYDSMGAPGDNPGFDSFQVLGGFVDITPKDQSDSETFLHLMASGLSVGLPLQGSTIADRFLSERSAIKMLLGTNGNGLTYSELTAKNLGGNIGSNKPGMKLKQFTVPNTIIEGKFSGKNLATSVIVIEGNIESVSDQDRYRFRFDKGQYITAEVISFASSFGPNALNDPVITGLTISKEEADGTLAPLFTSFQEFEAFDPLLFDFKVPESGNYVLTVFAQTFTCSPPDPINNCIDLVGEDEFFNTGDYEMLVYSVDKALGPP